MSFFWPFDFSILNNIQQNRTDFLDYFFSTITHLADKGIFWIILGLVLCVFVKTRKTGSTVLLALLFGLIVCNILLKNIIARARPWTVEEYSLIKDASNQLLIGLPHDWSFPSGHTTSSFAAATALFCFNKKYGSAALVLAALIAFSRIYLYVHFPSDVIAGIIVGVTVGVIAYLVVKILCNYEKTGLYAEKYLNFSIKLRKKSN